MSAYHAISLPDRHGGHSATSVIIFIMAAVSWGLQDPKYMCTYPYSLPLDKIGPHVNSSYSDPTYR
jgi:hypothetical protein